jgi:FkbM family methyltransferase
MGLSKRRFLDGGGIRFFANPISEFGLALRRGEHEPEMRSLLARFLKPGGIFVDLGANEGYFSVIASGLVGPAGKVVAVEPQSRLQSVLKMNFDANHCGNIMIEKVAVCSGTGKVQMRISSERNTGSTSLYQTTRYPQNQEEVASVTLEDLFRQAGIERCDLMKVDIEGAEYDALMGAGDVLKRGIARHIALEYHDPILERRGVSGPRLHSYLLDCGYAADKRTNLTVYDYRGE